MWWFFGVILMLLFILMVYERYCFFIEKFDTPLPTTLLMDNKEKNTRSLE